MEDPLGDLHSELLVGRRLGPGGGACGGGRAALRCHREAEEPEAQARTQGQAQAQMKAHAHAQRGEADGSCTVTAGRHA